MLGRQIYPHPDPFPNEGERRGVGLLLGLGIGNAGSQAATASEDRSASCFIFFRGSERAFVLSDLARNCIAGALPGFTVFDYKLV
jgi:hypothetical protein